MAQYGSELARANPAAEPSTSSPDSGSSVQLLEPAGGPMVQAASSRP